MRMGYGHAGRLYTYDYTAESSEVRVLLGFRVDIRLHEKCDCG